MASASQVAVILIFANPPTTIEAAIKPAPDGSWDVEPTSPEGRDAFLRRMRDGLRPPEPQQDRPRLG